MGSCIYTKYALSARPRQKGSQFWNTVRHERISVSLQRRNNLPSGIARTYSMMSAEETSLILLIFCYSHRVGKKIPQLPLLLVPTSRGDFEKPLFDSGICYSGAPSLAPTRRDITKYTRYTYKKGLAPRSRWPELPWLLRWAGHNFKREYLLVLRVGWTSQCPNYSAVSTRDWHLVKLDLPQYWHCLRQLEHFSSGEQPVQELGSLTLPSGVGPRGSFNNTRKWSWLDTQK